MSRPKVFITLTLRSTGMAVVVDANRIKMIQQDTGVPGSIVYMKGLSPIIVGQSTETIVALLTSAGGWE